MDKKETKYFMTEMTQKEFEEMCKLRRRSSDFETGWTKEERFIMNKIRSDQIQKMENHNKE